MIDNRLLKGNKALIVLEAVAITFLSGFKKTTWTYPVPCIPPGCDTGYSIGFPFAWWAALDTGELHVRTVIAIIWGFPADVIFWIIVLLIIKKLMNKFVLTNKK